MYFTKSVLLEVSFLIGCWAVIQASPASLLGQDAQAASLDQDVSPQERLFLPVYQCASSSGRTGTCRSSFDCAFWGGIEDGRCSFFGIKVCCVAPAAEVPTPSTQACGSTTDSNMATLVNPNYPSPETAGGQPCTMSVTAASDVCHLRLDLIRFSLAQPNSEGICATDSLTVTGTYGPARVPTICGDNNGQHMYVHVSPGDTVDLDIIWQSAGAIWNIVVTQIPCDSPDAPPDDCLQYFTATSGTITSFNFRPSASILETSQLADQFYRVCIMQQDDYCNVTYSQTPGTRFSVTGDPGGLSPGIPPIATVGYDYCTTDYIFIVYAIIEDTTNVEQPPGTMGVNFFCGYAFPTATAFKEAGLFSLRIVSDSVETDEGDAGNQGFQLDYTQNPC